MIDINSPADLANNIINADVALLDFWAPWCGPCRGMMPALEQLQANNPELVIGKVNVDDNRELAQTFGIRSIPTLVLFRAGEATATLMGAHPLERLQAFIDSAKG